MSSAVIRTFGHESRSVTASRFAPRKMTFQFGEKIAAARAGDEPALEEVIRHYQDRIAGYVISLVGKNPAELDDLCQTVFVKMALSLSRLKSIDHFEPWLFTIARNVCRDYLRRSRSRSFFVPLSRDHDRIPAEEAEEPRLASGAIEMALARLSARERELIELLRGRDYSYEELSRLTKTSVRAVAGRLFRARSRLRRLLQSGSGL